MSSEAIRRKFLKFFEERGHAMVPSSSLIPDDPSVLLTTAGMQQFKKYYTGERDAMEDFGSKNTVSIQKSFRTSDIDEVGDDSHLTFFEMMGNFSFGYKPGEPGSPKGGYFKKEAITYAFDFITKEMKLPISYVTVFQGSDVVPKDEESKNIWQSLGIEDVREDGMEDVFWGPTGTSGPCGPTTEIYCKNGAGQDIEVWNIVFNEFFCSGSREELLAGKAELKPLPMKGIDTGMGLERLAMCAQQTKTIFETDLFDDLKKNNLGNFFIPNYVDERVRRVILDHVRAIVFLICDGVEPSNKGAGYILRRLMRRVVVHQYIAHDPSFDVDAVLNAVVFKYQQVVGYDLDIVKVLRIFHEEDSKFLSTIKSGLEELDEAEVIDAPKAFYFFSTFGLPYEIIKEFARGKADRLTREGFEKEFDKHQEISRAGQEKKFGGHGLVLDTGELRAGSEEELKKVMRLHTATHLLHQALRDVLGNEVRQMGSDITTERTRFDFAFHRKLTGEEVKKIEEIVNEKIREGLTVSFEEMSKEEAEKTGALHFFKEKYPDKVKVYFVGPSLEEAYSKEFCGGPHVKNTSEIGAFKIVKEEAVGAGARRIRAVVS